MVIAKELSLKGTNKMASDQKYTKIIKQEESQEAITDWSHISHTDITLIQ